MSALLLPSKPQCESTTHCNVILCLKDNLLNTLLRCERLARLSIYSTATSTSVKMTIRVPFVNHVNSFLNSLGFAGSMHRSGKKAKAEA